MSHYYYNNGEEATFGDKVVISKKITDPFFGDTTMKQVIPFTEKTAGMMLREGIITKTPDLDDYISKLENRLGWKKHKMANYLDHLDSIYPAAAFSIILREIAIDLDKKYPDHIEKSPEIYVICMLDGKIKKVNKKQIKNYRNFAAFRTIEDAKFACSIVREILKDLFKNGK